MKIKKKKNILKDVPLKFVGDVRRGMVEWTDNNVKTPRKEITTKAMQFIEYCGERGYVANVCATPEDCFEKLQSGQEVVNVILGSVSAAHLVYLMARQLKYSAQTYGTTPEEMLKLLSDIVKDV